MSDLDPRSPQGGNGRWLKVALFVSLALNLAVAGLFMGAGFGGHPVRPGMRHDVGLGPLTEGLTRQDRKTLRAMFEQARPEFRAERRATNEDFRALAALMQAEVWDDAAAGALLERQSDRLAARTQAGQSVLIAYVASLPAERRKALGARLEATLRDR